MVILGRGKLQARADVGATLEHASPNGRLAPSRTWALQNGSALRACEATLSLRLKHGYTELNHGGTETQRTPRTSALSKSFEIEL
jgi:hypothetical protein